MTDLQDRLGRLAPEVDSEADLARLHTRARIGRRRRRLATGAVALAMVAAGVVGAVLLAAVEEDADDGVVTEPAPERPAIEEGWVDLPDAPLPNSFSPLSQQAAWTGEEFLWFGYAEVSADLIGAAFDPDAMQWRRLADAPIRSRAAAAVVWTGAELVVWGGADVAHGVPYTGVRYDEEGAAYDPVTDSWRQIAPAPVAAREGAAAVWTGDELIVAGGQRFDGPPECPDRETCLSQGRVGLPTTRLQADAAAYDPVTDGWRRLADPPGEVGSVTTWTGEEMLVFPGSSSSLPGTPGGTAYDLATDSWRALGADTLDGKSVFGDRFAAAGGIGLAFREGEPPHWYVYNPGTDVWEHRLDLANHGFCQVGVAAAGDAVAAFGCGQAVHHRGTASWYPLDGYPVEGGDEVADVVSVQALGGSDGLIMAMGPRTYDPASALPPDWTLPRFVGYQADLATYAVPDVEGLTLGEAREVMAEAGFDLSAHETDPQGDDAVVRVQEPPAGTPLLGIVTEVGVRTDPPR